MLETKKKRRRGENLFCSKCKNNHPLIDLFTTRRAFAIFSRQFDGKRNIRDAYSRVIRTYDLIAVTYADASFKCKYSFPSVNSSIISMLANHLRSFVCSLIRSPAGDSKTKTRRAAERGGEETQLEPNCSSARDSRFISALLSFD